MRKPGPFSSLASMRKRFSDNFNRPDTEDDLGFTEDQSRWDAVRGIFRILSNLAYAPPEQNQNYPIASVNMPYQDVEISISAISNGSGAALWVTDSGNWWGLGLEQEEVDCNCSYGTDCNRWNQGGICLRWNAGNCNRWNSGNCNRWTCATFNSSSCGSWNAGNCRTWEFAGVSGPFPFFRCSTWNTRNCRAWNASNCSSNACNRWNSRNCNRWNTRNCNRWTDETCNQWFEFAFNCQTCYPQWIRIVQSISTTITTKARFLITKTFTSQPSPFGNFTDFRQTTFVNKVIQSIKIFTKGNRIEADLFYETGFSDKVDVEQEIVYNATGATVNTSYGIMIVPSQNDQTNFIGPIEIDKN